MFIYVFRNDLSSPNTGRTYKINSLAAWLTRIWLALLIAPAEKGPARYWRQRSAKSILATRCSLTELAVCTRTAMSPVGD